MNKPLGIAAAILFAVILLPTSAQARHHHYRHHQHYRIQTDATPSYAYGQAQYRVAYANYERQMQRYNAEVGHVVSHPAGCPGRAFCGCGVSVKVFGHPVHSLFLASNWRRFPTAAPAAGMVAVRNHHVMYIMAYDGHGNATVYDPNSGGHATRIHERSLAGYTVVNPHGSRMAQI